MKQNLIKQFHCAMTNNRWLRRVDTSNSVPEVRDIVIGALLGTLFVVVLVLIGTDGIIHENFLRQPLPYIASVFLLVLASYALYLMLFSLVSRIRRLRNSRFRANRGEKSGG